METLFIGRNLIFLPEVPSTNSYAMNLLKNVNPPEGSVIHAAYQTQGRGQRGSTWNAEPQSNLTASFILKPNFLSFRNQFYLYIISALACYDTMADILDSSQFDIKIKWPNDILVDKKKVAGILIENNVLNNQIHGCIIGIGINLNQVNFEPGLKATSARVLTGSEVPVFGVLERLCLKLEKHYLALKQEKFENLMASYLQRFFGLNEWMTFDFKQQRKKLMVTGISDNGLLLLEDENSQILQVDVKEVSWIY